MDDFTIIQDGKLSVVIDQHGDPKFDSYWEKDCHDWIKEEEDWWGGEDDKDDDCNPLPHMISRMLQH